MSWKFVARLVVYPLILHFFGLVQLWHKLDNDKVFDDYKWGFEFLTKRPVSFPVALTDSMFPAIPMPWSPKGAEVIGMCHPLVLSDFQPEIQINRKYWVDASEYEKYLLVFHEMGHCKCHLMHDSDILADGCPKSIMSPYLPNEVCAEKHFIDYMIDLSKRCRK